MSLFRNYFKQLANRHHHSPRIGLCVSEQAVSLLVVDTRDKTDSISTPKIINTLHILREPGKKLQACQQAVKDFIAQHNLHKHPCVSVLSESAYQMLLIDPPDVPESEQVDAIRWKIRDLIQEDIEQSIISAFPQVNGKKLYAVVTEKARLQEIVDFVGALGLSLKAIDIEELAYRNYFDKHPMMDRGIAVITVIDNEGKLFIFKQGNLYFTRKFTINNQAKTFALIEDDFILEVQRSLDYYERQMGQSSPAEILLCGQIVANDISAAMKNSFQQQISCIDIYAANDAEINLPNHLVVSVAGAAIRESLV